MKQKKKQQQSFIVLFWIAQEDRNDMQIRCVHNRFWFWLGLPSMMLSVVRRPYLKYVSLSLTLSFIYLCVSVFFVFYLIFFCCSWGVIDIFGWKSDSVHFFSALAVICPIAYIKSCSRMQKGFSSRYVSEERREPEFCCRFCLVCPWKFESSLQTLSWEDMKCARIVDGIFGCRYVQASPFIPTKRIMSGEFVYSFQWNGWQFGYQKNIIIINLKFAWIKNIFYSSRCFTSVLMSSKSIGNRDVVIARSTWNLTMRLSMENVDDAALELRNSRWHRQKNHVEFFMCITILCACHSLCVCVWDLINVLNERVEHHFNWNAFTALQI